MAKPTICPPDFHAFQARGAVLALTKVLGVMNIITGIFVESKALSFQAKTAGIPCGQEDCNRNLYRQVFCMQLEHMIEN